VPAFRMLEETEELRRRVPLGVTQFQVRDVVEEPALQLDVGRGLEEETVAVQPIPPGAAHLLVPRLDILRHVAVNDARRLVDPRSHRVGFTASSGRGCERLRPITSADSTAGGLCIFFCSFAESTRLS